MEENSQPNEQAHAFLTALGIRRPVYWLIREKALTQKRAEERTDRMPHLETCAALGDGVFTTPNELGTEANNRGHLRHEANVIRFTSVFVDMDDGTKGEQMTRLTRLGIEPSILVETGRGFHAYWVLERFEPVDAQDWRRVQSELAFRMGGDKACVDPARLMRLPGSMHVKGVPIPVKLLECNGTRVYSLDDFPKQAVRASSAPLSTNKRVGPFQIRYPLVRPLAEGTRHAALVHEGARLLRGAAPSDLPEIRAVLKAWYSQSCIPLKRDWEREVDSYLDDWLIPKEFGSFKP